MSGPKRISYWIGEVVFHYYISWYAKKVYLALLGSDRWRVIT